MVARTWTYAILLTGLLLVTGIVAGIAAEEPPNAIITARAQDSAGTDWIATSTGLYRHDQSGWKLFTASASGLLSDTVNDIAVDHDDRVWCATDSGLVVFDGDVWEPHTAEAGGPPMLPMTDVVVDGDGMVWATAINPYHGSRLLNQSGIYRLNESQWVQDYSGYMLLDLELSPEGILWLGCLPMGGDKVFFSVSQWNGTGWEGFVLYNYFLDAYLSFDDNGILHVTGHINATYDGKTWIRTDLPELASHDELPPDTAFDSPWFPLHPGNSWTYTRYQENLERHPIDSVTFTIIGAREVDGVWHAVFLDGREFWIDEDGSVQPSFDLTYETNLCDPIEQNILDASYFRTCSTREVPAGNFTGIQYSWGETTGAWEKHFLVEYIGPVYQYFGTDYWPAETYDLTDYSLVAPVSVAETPSPSTALVLDTPFPNPFNAVTALPFTLAADGHVRAAVYNLAGQRVRTLLSGTVLPAGNHTLSWDGCDDAGLTAASGVYLVQVIQGDHHRTARVCFVK